MCYNASLKADKKAIEARYHRQLQEADSGQLPYMNVSAFSRPWWPVLGTDDREHIAWKQWGLIPSFGKADPKAFLAKTPTFNAISEEASSKPSFSEPWKNGQRCLIPVTHFREWQHIPIPGKKAVNKIPYDIASSTEPIFSLAGLFDGDTFTILTRPANELMARIHNNRRRMPVIVPRAFEGDWLSPHLEHEDVMRFCRSLEGVELEAKQAQQTSPNTLPFD